jgi:hypothetical protein
VFDCDVKMKVKPSYFHSTAILLATFLQHLILLQGRKERGKAAAGDALATVVLSHCATVHNTGIMPWRCQRLPRVGAAERTRGKD